MSESDDRVGPSRSRRSTGYRARSFYLPDELYFALRNAWYATHEAADGHDSVSELVADALRERVGELQRRHNDGEPFPDVPEGVRLTAGASGRARQAEAVRALNSNRSS